MRHGVVSPSRCVLGVDPGTALMGYAVVTQDGASLSLLTAGALETSSEMPMPQRLAVLYDGLIHVIEEFHPTDVAVEDLFFNRNLRSAVAVGQARGVVLLAAAHRDLSVASYTPLQVKEAVTGFGRARKQQIQEMVRVLLNLPAPLRPDDAADAAALAVCHLNHASADARYRTLTQSSDRAGMT